MNNTDQKYTKFALCREMLETSQVLEKMDPEVVDPFVDAVRQTKNILITGEGSSRIFPAKHFRYQLLSQGIDYNVVIEGATQAVEYKLEEYAVFGVSNSGKTKELVGLFSSLKENGHSSFFGITVTANTPVANWPIASLVLSCGAENAVAATKSVAEQAMIFDLLLNKVFNRPLPSFNELSVKINETLTMNIDQEIVRLMRNSPVVYFAGRNDGVAEELALKTNEITRKRSDYLEGTYALHGIEEVMNAGEVLVVIDPFEQEEAKFKSVLVDGVGVHVIAISSRKTIFPTIQIPDASTFKNYLELTAGWNLLVEVGIALGIDLDKPVRARKIGNEA